MDELVRVVDEEFKACPPCREGEDWEFVPLLVCLTSTGLTTLRKAPTGPADEFEEWLVATVQRERPLACAWAFTTVERVMPKTSEPMPELGVTCLWIEGVAGVAPAVTAACIIYLIAEQPPVRTPYRRGFDDFLRICPWTAEPLRETVASVSGKKLEKPSIPVCDG